MLCRSAKRYGSGVLDVNDAQMIYDMYMSVYKLDELT